MSALARLRVWRVAAPLIRPFVTSVRRADAIDVVLVEATDADGRSGWGEAATSWRVTGESPAGVSAVVTGPLADAVIGKDPADPAGAAALAASVWGNAAARSGVECALADLSCRQRGTRLGEAFAQDAATRIRTDMTLSAAAPEELAERACEHVAAGFASLKVKVSADTDLHDSLAAVRDAVGDGVELRADANQAWDVDTAIRSIRACEDAGLELAFVEQPVAAHDLDGLARVTAAVSTPVMADESVRTIEDVHEIAHRSAADLVNIKLAKTGGPAEAWNAARAAQEAGLGVVFGCMMEGHVGVAAAASLAAAFAPRTVHDLDAAIWLQRSPVIGGIRYDGDEILLPESAGIGVEGITADAGAELLAERGSRANGAAA